MGRVLIIRFSAIGDVLLTTPIVRALHRAGWEVHYLTKAVHAPLLAHNPYLSRLHLLAPGQSLFEMAAQLRPFRFEWVVDLHKSLRSYLLRRLLRRPVSAYSKETVKRRQIVSGRSDVSIRHVVERYFDALKPLGVGNDGQGPEFFFPPDYRFSLPVSLPPAYGVVVVGAKHFTKRIPPSKVQQFLRAARWPVVLLGGEDVAAAGKEIAAAFPEAVNLVGRTSLYDSAYLIREAAWVLTPDTGMMHLAAALRRPIISVWGATSPRLGMAPYLKEPAPRLVEDPTLPCHPCHRYGRSTCPEGHFRCMLGLDLAAEGRRLRTLFPPPDLSPSDRQ